MRSRTQILQCKVLLKGIEFDFPLGKELKIDWKLPKSQFSIYSVIRKIKNRIENCPKPIFICLKLLKIENWIENRQKINFHFFEIIENWTKMKFENWKLNWKLPKNQFSFFWNYWKLNKNEMDVFVHGWLVSLIRNYPFECESEFDIEFEIEFEIKFKFQY